MSGYVLPECIVERAKRLSAAHITRLGVEQTGALTESVAILMMDCYLAGLKEYAWWKDGTEHVGTCGTTLKVAKQRALEAARMQTVDL